MRRFPHGGEVLGASPANPLLAPVLRPALELSRQQALLDLQAIQRIPGLAGYWPADPAYLFEDSAGTIPASVNGVVGHVREFRTSAPVLGAEELVNYDFSAGLTGWTVNGSDATHTVTVESGGVRYLSDTTSPVLELTQTGKAAGLYQVTTDIEYTSVAGGLKAEMTNNVGGPAVLGSGVNTYYLVCPAGGTFSVYREKTNVNALIKSVSLKPVSGALPALQNTTTKKPILKRTPTSNVYWLNSDADDELTATLGNLGSACTVAQAGAEGVTFTEGVTISSTYNIAPAFGFNGDVAIFNRALTTTEKALVTRYMSRGVPLLGSNLVTNGTFDTDLTGWSADAAFTWDSGAARAASTGYLSQTLSNAASPLGTQLCIQYSYASSTGRFRLNTGPISNLPLPATISGTSGTITYSGAKVNTNLVMQSMDANANLTTDNFSVRVIL